MKHQIVLPACLLLLWTLTAFVSCQAKVKDITVTLIPDGIKLRCGGNKLVKSPNGEKKPVLELDYKDENTGEYTCLSTEDDEGAKIFVKFRTCDNCVELDTASISGIVIGNVVATIMIGVAVYLTASQARSGPITSHKKSSDRQHLVPNETPSRAPNDHYQPLKHKSGQKDMYDVLHNKK